MFLNRHYLKQLNDAIYITYKPEEYHLRGTKGVKGGIYFLAGVFVIDNELISLVKIGETKNIFTRIKGIYTDNPSSLYLIYFHKVLDEKQRKEVEKDYHYKFKEYCFRDNREWFHLKPIVISLGLDWEKMNEE